MATQLNSAQCRFVFPLLALLGSTVFGQLPVPRDDSTQRPQGAIVGWGHSPHYGEFVGTYTAIAAGDYHSVGLKADGSVVGQGTNYYGEAHEPLDNSGFVGIAAGAYGSAGWKDDGSIVGWGRSHVPPISGDFIAISVAEYHAVGLKADGSMEGWGCWICCGHPPDPWNTGACDIPPPNIDFVAVAAGDVFSVGLRADESIVWFPGGQNVFPPNSGFVAIAAAHSHSLGLKSDGSVVPFGCIYYPYAECNVPFPNSDFISIDAAYKFSLGLKADGSIVAWGDNTYGLLNIPTPNAHYIAIAAGPHHGLAIRGSPADWDSDGRIDSTDHAVLGNILGSPDSGPDSMPTFRAWYLFDLDDDHDVDLNDFALFENRFTD